MTLEEKMFYYDDEKKYYLKENKEFLDLIDQIKNTDYQKNIDITACQYLVDFIANWYELKNSNQRLEELLSILPVKLHKILDCLYWGSGYIKEDDNTKKMTTMIKISQKVDSDYYIPGPGINLLIDSVTGEIHGYNNYNSFFNERETIFNKKLILERKYNNINYLYYILSRYYSNELELLELKQSIITKNGDREIRNYLLGVIALKLLYSKSNDLESSYQKVLEFIDDFNNYYNIQLNDNISLFKDDIDKIVNKYRKINVKVKKINRQKNN